MKKYINAKVEIYNLDAGDIMFLSSDPNELNMDDSSFNNEKGYNSSGAWGNWNS